MFLVSNNGSTCIEQRLFPTRSLNKGSWRIVNTGIIINFNMNNEICEGNITFNELYYSMPAAIATCSILIHFIVCASEWSP